MARIQEDTNSAGVVEVLRGDEMLSSVADAFAANKISGAFLCEAASAGDTTTWAELCETLKLNAMQGMRLNQMVRGGGLSGKRRPRPGSRVKERKKKARGGHRHTFNTDAMQTDFTQDDDDEEAKGEKENRPPPRPLDQIEHVSATQFGLLFKREKKSASRCCTISKTFLGLAMFAEDASPFQRALGGGFTYEMDEKKTSYIMTFSDAALVVLREKAAKRTQKGHKKLVTLTPQLIVMAFKQIYEEDQKEKKKKKMASKEARDEATEIAMRLESAENVQKELDVKPVSKSSSPSQTHAPPHTTHSGSTCP